jgi:hypothetical protein
MRTQLAQMNQDLETIFRELGIAQYLDTFVEQGFDTWDTILDIQESDLWVNRSGYALMRD